MPAEPYRFGPVTRRELLALAGMLLLGALLLGRNLALPSSEFDEQVYLASADLLRRGYQLGTSVFTSQPPLFFSFLRAASRLTGGDATLIRALSIALTLAGAVAGWAVARARGGRVAGLVAGALVLASPGVVDAAAVVSADVPSVALGTLALLAAQIACTHARAVWGLAAGTLLACALLTKLLAVPFAPAILALAIVHRPPRKAVLLFVAGFTGVLGAALGAYAGVLGSVWEGAVGLHLAARKSDIHFPTESILWVVVMIVLSYLGLLAILAVGALHAAQGGWRDWARRHVDLLMLLICAVAFCAVQRPLMAHHLVIVAWPLAMLAGSSLPARYASRRSLAVVTAGALLVLPWMIHGRMLESEPQRAELLGAATDVARHTAPGALIVSDLPEVPLMARRIASPPTVDPSYVRVETGELSPQMVERASRTAGAVVVGRAFELIGGLDTVLRARFMRVTHYGPVTVWTAPRPAARRLLATTIRAWPDPRSHAATTSTSHGSPPAGLTTTSTDTSTTSSTTRSSTPRSTTG